LGLDDAWDNQTAEMDEHGRFELRGIPANASVSVSTRVKGYRFSGKNASLDPWHPFHLEGRLNKDKSDLVILLEPGVDQQSSPGNRNVSPEEHPKHQPLRGAEAPADLSDQWVISGQVVDAETRQPIARFKLTPGRQEDRPSLRARNWETHRTAEYTNGTYSITLPKRSTAPLLMVEAEGYLPTASPPLSAGQTNCHFALKKGTGPEGTVLLPNGEPAAGVSVFLFGPGEQFGLLQNGQIRAYWSRDASRTMDSAGRFSFPPRLEDGKLYVAAEQGFAEATTQQLASNPKIALQPWSRIKGTLIKAGKPATNETLSVSSLARFAGDEPRMNLQHRAVTDAQGRFEFDHVPAGEWQVVTLVPIDSSAGLARGWTHQQQALVTAKPGETVTLEVEKNDAPPPGLRSSVPPRGTAKP
jgi:hypothetical protein